MQVTHISTEQTTAATDAGLALVCLLAASQVWLRRNSNSKKARIWAAMFASVAIAALLGMVAHGLELERELRVLLWKPLNALLGLAVCLFALGAVEELWTDRLTRRVVSAILGSGFLFFAVTLFAPGKFLLFVLYETSAMTFAFRAYFTLLVRRHTPGAAWMLLGVVLTVIAAAIQAANKVALTLIWRFDHNGLFHLTQIAAMLFLLFGLKVRFYWEEKAGAHDQPVLGPEAVATKSA